MADPETTYREAMSAGHSAAWDLEWARAAEYYSQALEAKPRDYQALTSLGLALFERHQFDEALQMYGQAAQVLPNEPVPWEKMAHIYERQGNIRRAIEAALQAADRFMKRGEAKRGIENYLRVVRLDPENLLAHTHLALIYDRLQQLDRAVEEYLAVAALLQRQGKVQDATRAVQRALTLVPNDPAVRQAMASLQRSILLPKPTRPRGGTNPLRMAKIRQTGADDADDEIEDAAASDSQLDPIAQARQRALTLLAEVLFEEAETDVGPGRQGNLDTLMRGMTSPAARRRQRSRILLLLGRVVDEQTQGNSAQAAEELRRAVDAGLDHAAAYFDLGMLLLETEKPAEALRYLQSAVSHPDFTLATHLLIARASHQLGKKVEAAQHALEALRIADMAVVPPEQAEVLGQLYEPLIAQVASDANEETLDRIVENVEQLLVQPDWQQRVRAARQQLDQEARDSDGVLPLADMLIEAQSGRIVEALGRVRALLADGAWGAALEEAQMALAYAPAYLPLHVLMADILAERGMTDIVEEKYLTVARTYLARGNAARAVELYRKVLEHNPAQVEAHARLVEALISQNQLEEAIAHYMEMAQSYYQLAELQQAQHVYERALRLARRLPNNRSWQLRILRKLADLAEQQLDWRQAALVYEQIRTLEPKDEQMRSKLIGIRLKLGRLPQAMQELDDYIEHQQRGGDLNKMIDFLKTLVEQHPDVGELQMRLGQLYAMTGRRRKAIAAYDAAGEKFLDADQTDKAIQAIEAILALEPQDAEAYREALAQLREQLSG